MFHDQAFAVSTRNSLELVRGIKVALLRLQQSPADAALASALPCARQAIHELSDFDGCKHIVAFSCVFESALGRVRDAELVAETELSELLLSCCDLVSEMLNQLATNDTEPLSRIFVAHLEKSLELIRQLRAHHGYRHNLEGRWPETSISFLPGDGERRVEVQRPP